ncbi:MAG TPA: helix-turn-helix domain-containing protein [Polyangiaceae bacterium]|nr:helix-turn-helix domain-containing protein [Polyangiaceae bacterium]
MSSERLFVRTAKSTRIWPVPDAATSAFFEAEPIAALRACVRKVRWGHESIETPVDELIVPDGALHLIVVLADGGARPYGLAVGASTAPSVVNLSGNVRHVELELEAGGSLALFGVPARSLEGQAVPLDDLWGDEAVVLGQRLAEAKSDPDRVRVAQEMIAARAGHHTAPPIVRGALEHLRRVAGQIQVRQMADRLGVSERRLEQLFQQYVGLTPKASCRVARFQRVIDRMASSKRRASWAELALEAGFVDQSHLANDIRALTGLSPTRLVARGGFGFLQD